MVKIAVAGPGHVARELIDGLVATGKHDIILLSRRDATPDDLIKGTAWVKVDFLDRQGLVQALEGVHTVLSFVTVHQDTDNAVQKALIDAAIEAGVKRIAPSEWGVAHINHLDWYENKVHIRKYLQEKNKDKKVIEYCLFQPGWFMNYIAGTRKTLKHIQPTGFIFVDHENRRARGPGDLTDQVTYTAVHDVVNIVVKAIDYEGEWPEVGGINGHTLSPAEEIAIGEKVMGAPFEVEKLALEDLRAGVVKTSWLPTLDIPGFAEADRVALSQHVLCGMMLHLADGTGFGTDEWNRIFPDYKFTTVEEFLSGVFKDA